MAELRRGAEKRLRALNLRKAGATYEQIAQQLGYANRGTAHKAVRYALAEQRGESPRESHRLDEQRLDQLLMALWPKAMKGDGWAVDRILRIIELRRDPEPVESRGTVEAAVRSDLERLPEELRGSGLAATALELARNVDTGRAPATSARELRAVLAQLDEKAKPDAPEVSKPVEEGSVAAILDFASSRRRPPAG